VFLLYPTLGWPVVYSEIFWPADLYAEDWSYGYGTILEGAFATYEPEPWRPRRRAAALARPGPAAYARLCQEQAIDPPDATVERIAQAVDPTEAQRAALEELRAAMIRAAELLRTSCPSDLSPSPIARLDLMEHQADVMLQALEIIRPALEKFDRSLTEEQRARFALLGARADRHARSTRRGEPAAACKRQASELADWPMRRIEQVVRPTEAQRNALIDLWAASAKAANALNAGCSPEVPVSPLARLRLMQERLDAMRQAAKTVRAALADFYKSLSEEQRARFDHMNAPAARGHG